MNRDSFFGDLIGKTSGAGTGPANVGQNSPGTALAGRRGGFPVRCRPLEL